MFINMEFCAVFYNTLLIVELACALPQGVHSLTFQAIFRELATHYALKVWEFLRIFQRNLSFLKAKRLNI
jgi:hypothetical protein